MRTEELTRRLRRLRAPPALVVDGAAWPRSSSSAVALDRIEQPAGRSARPRSPWPSVLTLTMAGALVARRSLPARRVPRELPGAVRWSRWRDWRATCRRTPTRSRSSRWACTPRGGTPAWGRRSSWSRCVVYFAGDPVTPASDAIGVLFVWLATWAVGYSHGPPARGAGAYSPRGPAAGRRRGTDPGGPGAARRGRPHRQPARRPGRRRPAACSTRTRRRRATCLPRWSRPAATRWPTSTTCSPTCATDRPPTDEHPTPGLAQIPDLVDRLTDSRIRVTLTDGPRPAAPAQPRPLGVPDRAGGPHQRAQARGAVRRDGRRTPGRRRRGRRSDGRRTGTARPAPPRPRPDRDRRAGGDLRWDGWSRATAPEGGFRVRAVLPLP